MKPFSTYPEDREKLLDLASKASCSDDAASIGLADMVKAILDDEQVAITDISDVVAVLRDAYTALAFAFHRIESSSRGRDVELASNIGKIRARIEPVLKFYDAPATVAEPVA